MEVTKDLCNWKDPIGLVPRTDAKNPWNDYEVVRSLIYTDPLIGPVEDGRGENPDYDRDVPQSLP